MKKQQTGFTLIELVIVIVILGLLAATALPRFADLTGDAREASLRGIEGAVRSASAIVHAQALVDGVATGANSVNLEGTNVLTLNGYPNVTDINDAVDIPGTTATAAGVFSLQANCTVDYDNAPVNGTPTITVDISGC